MDRFVIEGGQPLRGKVAVAGAKNAALPLISAALLSEQPVVLQKVPRLADVRTLLRLLTDMGLSHHWAGDQLSVQAHEPIKAEAPYECVKTMRASILVLGPLVARFGRARVSLPGGCAIGQRPVNLHLAGLRALGAQVEVHGGYIEAKAARLVGARFEFDTVSVTGTENLMMAATLARGTTVLGNAACEPEVSNLGELLNRMGAQIEGLGTPTLTITGVSSLHGAQAQVMGDRIEAGTLLVAAAMTRGDVSLSGVPVAALAATLAKLSEAGCELDVQADQVRLTMTERPRAVDIHTAPFPGFATDMQAQLMALNTIAHGQAWIHETIFENRFMHVMELQRMGADISVDGHTARVRGVEQLEGATVMATDLRASAALVIAALAASGTSRIERIYHLDRGYEALETKLASLGARIQRESRSGD